MDASTIIADQVAIWGPKANDAVSVKEVAVGTPYKTKGSQIISRAEKGMIRVAKNYFVGGEPADKPSLSAETENESKNVSKSEDSLEGKTEVEQPEALEDTSGELADNEAIDSQEENEEVEKNELEESKNISLVTKEEQADKAQNIKPKFCLFVRSSRSATEIERKLDLIATKITESQALAAIGRVNTVGPMSFEYTNFNLEEID